VGWDEGSKDLLRKFIKTNLFIKKTKKVVATLL
jgi:hypothetical protein